MCSERQAAADYVAALSTELAQIAYRHGLDSTAYMLEIAAAEAASCQTGGAERTLRPLDALLG